MKEQGKASEDEHPQSEDRGGLELCHNSCNEPDGCCRRSQLAGTGEVR